MTGPRPSRPQPPAVSPAVSPARSALLAAAAGATAAVGVRLAWTGLTAAPPGGRPRWERTNHRGEPVSLLEGPAVAAGLVAGLALVPSPRLRAAGMLAAAGAGAMGLIDDLAERGAAKGLRGHLGALRRGELTTGSVKIAGLGLTGLAAAALVLTDPDRDHPGSARPGPTRPVGAALAADVLVAGALVAGSANLVNLFDLRPGRALKVSLLAAPAVLGAGPATPLVAAVTGAAAAALPEDLAERAMLGDCGANALGAVLGLATVAGTGRRSRLVALGSVTALVLASERVSFTAVIAATPGLRELDALGRRPR